MFRRSRSLRTSAAVTLRGGATEQLVFGGAARVDAADPSYTPEHAPGTRLLADRHGVQAVGLAVRLLGNPGLARGNPLQCTPVHAPQEDISVLAIGTKPLQKAADAQDREDQ